MTAPTCSIVLTIFIIFIAVSSSVAENAVGSALMGAIRRGIGGGKVRGTLASDTHHILMRKALVARIHILIDLFHYAERAASQDLKKRKVSDGTRAVGLTVGAEGYQGFGLCSQL